MESSSSFRERFGCTRILWQTRLGAYCLGLDEFVPIKLVLSLDDGRDFDAIARQHGVRFFSLEAASGRREALDDLGIDWLIPALQRETVVAMESEPAGDWAAVSPYPGRTLAEFAAQMGIRCRCLDWRTFWRFSRKSTLLAGLTEMGLPRLPGRWTRLDLSGYRELASQFGRRFVAQLDVGAAGAGTVIAESEAEYTAASARFGDSEVWVTPYAGSLSFNVNAIATGRGTAVGYPSVQIVGQGALRSRRAGHCGNDFTAAAQAPQSMLWSIREQTVRIGEWMTAQGYRGLFGLDFVADDVRGEVCAVDLNPRWQGSTSLQAQAERRQGRVPLAAVEMAYQLGLADDCEVTRMADEFFAPIEGSQVFPKSRSPGSWNARGGLDAGVYSSKLAFLRPGLRLHELASPAEVLVTGGIPRPGRPMAPGVTLLRVSSLSAAVEPMSGRLHPWVEEAVQGLYAALDLQPAG
jgi:hypothetical protein